MTPEQRSNIDNGIWLCANHARQIDGDDHTYTVESIREMRRTHEENCSRELSSGAGALAGEDLIALGPDIVALGRIRSVESGAWTISLRHFLAGDVSSLVAYIERFGRLREEHRYVLLNEFGDGRVLTEAPALRTTPEGYEVECHIAPAADRDDAHNLPKDYALERGDLELENGGWRAVSGLDALPQTIRRCLLLARGESPLHPTFGSRLSEYCEEFRDSPWLARILKLDIIRLAAIPYSDRMTSSSVTPLRCVNRVQSVEVAEVMGEKLPLHVDLDVNGVGTWRCTIEVATERKPHPWSENPWLMRALASDNGRERS